MGPESQFSDFLDGLGPAQIVGRQTLATPPMGKREVGQHHHLVQCSPLHSHLFLSYKTSRGHALFLLDSV